MAKNYDDYKPVKSGRKPRKRHSMLPVYSLIVLLAVAIVAVSLTIVKFGLGNEKPNGNNVQTTGKENNNEPSSDNDGTEGNTSFETNEKPVFVPEPSYNLDDYITKEYAKSELNRGNLILVNSNYKYVFPEKDGLINIYGNKKADYRLSSSTLLIKQEALDALNAMIADFNKETGKTELLVSETYRTKEVQESKYNAYVEKHGEEEAQKYVSVPGASDKHTGYGIDFKIMHDDGTIDTFDKDTAYSWIAENCYKYGFVERFPSDKTDVTGIEYSGGYYLRYVGVPHAYIMHEEELCLEEYLLMYINKYEFSKNHRQITTEGGKTYEIYYIPQGDNKTTLYVPKANSYSISGNNYDGFIVTVER